MDTLDFKPNDEYLKLVEASEKRKLELSLLNLSYSQLARKKLFVKYQYELHHIEPRYRFKTKSKSLMNVAGNIAVLTVREHLLAHYYLTLFELGNFKHSADMAFIQLFSLSKTKPLFDLNTVESLIPAVEKARLDYFGSVAHKTGSKKAGKLSGEKRKKRFENDPEFRKHILLRLKRTPEQRKVDSITLIERNKTLPPWKVNASSGREDLIYKPQLWANFDSIYTGLIKYKLSYKAIARCLEVPYQRIHNIVWILRTKENLPNSFKDYEFYSDFIKDFQLNYPAFEGRFTYYSSNRIPWIANKKNEKPWYYFDLIFHKAVTILESGERLRMLDIHPFVITSVSSPRIHKEIIKLYEAGVREINDVPWVDDWLAMKSFYQIPPFLLKLNKCCE